MNQLVITTWDPTKKEYRLVTVMPGGKTSELGMAVEGSHRSLLYYAQVEGRLVRAEMTVDYSSQNEYSFREERTDQEKTWIYCEGTSRKRPENASNKANAANGWPAYAQDFHDSDLTSAGTRVLASGGGSCSR
ncbi:MAG: hypothetical protein ACR2ID_05325 [Chthoniobacterales bacterium]